MYKNQNLIGHPILFPIRGLTIKVPPFFDQEKIIKKIETIKAEIIKLKDELATLPTEKKEILKKYL